MSSALVVNFVYLGILAGLVVGFTSGIAAGSFLLGVLAYVGTGGLFVGIGISASLLSTSSLRSARPSLPPAYAIAAE